MTIQEDFWEGVDKGKFSIYLQEYINKRLLAISKDYVKKEDTISRDDMKDVLEEVFMLAGEEVKKRILAERDDKDIPIKINKKRIPLRLR